MEQMASPQALHKLGILGHNILRLPKSAFFFLFFLLLFPLFLTNRKGEQFGVTEGRERETKPGVCLDKWRNGADHVDF